MKKQSDFINYKLRINRNASERQQKYYEEQMKKRRLVGQPTTIEPWYSLNRNRNIFILSVMLTSLIFMKPITDAIMGLKLAYRLQQEEKKFCKQLDEEEAAEELQRQQQRQQKLQSSKN
ncbi:uncharacterized protein LOC124494175 [Dermatophagoides farinae]|uniref:Transmembrane protein n=1 Tax=Dermatophagoides farinae TaxID=6954 RepID=A0A922KZX6_DERFA|nr:uncharacterized protein LOC124494175 [Dermatophagoides farinae]KAH7643498.1 hypothetical protein HUG17_5860 [Dermatophagoides farinae]KAH9506333.1 hypothetical protein DERF_011071 [Dermatophagoides farinae]